MDCGLSAHCPQSVGMLAFTLRPLNPQKECHKVNVLEFYTLNLSKWDTVVHKSRNRPNVMGQQLKIEETKAQKYTTIEKMNDR